MKLIYKDNGNKHIKTFEQYLEESKSDTFIGKIRNFDIYDTSFTSSGFDPTHYGRVIIEAEDGQRCTIWFEEPYRIELNNKVEIFEKENEANSFLEEQGLPTITEIGKIEMEYEERMEQEY